MLSDATFVHSVWHFGCNLATKTKQWRRVGQSGRSGFMSTALWQYLLTMSTCLSMIQPLLQQTTNIWKIPAQTDLTCSGMLLQLCSGSDLRFCWSVPRSSAVSGWSLLLFVRKQPKKQNRRLLDCCIPVRLRTSAVHRACEVCEPTKHLRDTDSDYVMEKPSRCWLGAVPRYWKDVASCFQIVSFAENTSVPLAPWARISQPILLLFFCFLTLEFVYKTVSQIFFYSASKFSGVQKDDGIGLKRAIFGRFQIFNQLPVRNLKIWDTVFLRKDTRSKLKQTEQLFLDHTLS